MNVGVVKGPCGVVKVQARALAEVDSKVWVKGAGTVGMLGGSMGAGSRGVRRSTAEVGKVLLLRQATEWVW
jgi:hypothetical protein